MAEDKKIHNALQPTKLAKKCVDCFKQLIPKDALSHLVFKAPESRPSDCLVRKKCAFALFFLLTTFGTFCESDQLIRID